MEYMKLLEEICEQYRSICKDNLVGIYVHGSIAFGCYNPKKSDIDFLVVVKEAPSLKEKENMIRVLLSLTERAPKKGLEMSVVLEEECRHFQYPTPFELHFSNMHLESCKRNLKEYCKNMNGTDRDLASHFTVTRQVGFALYGKPVMEVFVEVPVKDYIDSMKYDVEDVVEEIKEEPVYFVLNLCRVLAYIAAGEVLSKEQGGRWALNNVPEKYHPLIREAVDCYRYESADDDKKLAENELLKEFAGYMHRCIFQTEY